MLKLNFTQRLGDLLLEVNETLPSKGITAIFGLSGAGKTSLINVISGLTQPKTGSIYLNGRALVDVERHILLPANKRRIGYVFQDARLFPHYRVKGNLKYGMADSMKAEFEAIVELLGISHLLERYPATLSGGEKQRVAIGRALLTAPELLLMDEPLASLDLPRKRELMPYIERLSREVNIPVLYVSHSIEEIVRLAEYVLVLESGRVLASGELEDVWSSETLRPWLAQQSHSSILNVELLEHHPKYDMSALTLGRQALWVKRVNVDIGCRFRIQMNAADISLALENPRQSSIRNILQAEVADYRLDNESVEVKLLIDNHLVWAHISRWAFDELAITKGQQIFAQIKSVSINRES
jgi:molybdate transport system ATP-binding protein